MVAFTKSPRRILGDRDVNTPCLTSPSKLTSNKTPGRKSALYFGAEDVVREATFSKALLSPKMGARIHSPSSGLKRRTSCTEDAREGGPRKQVIIGVLAHESEDDVVKWTGTKPRVLETSAPHVIDDIGLQEKTESTRQILSRLNSPDSSFDHTEDSIMEDSQNAFENSQNTAVTVPDEPTPAVNLPPAVTQIQALLSRVIPTEELRLKAETLKSKLQLAMYKVNTGQETTSFEQLQVSKAPTIPNRQRTPLPSRRPNKTPSPSEQHHYREITQTGNSNIEYDVICSPDGPVLEVTTPRKNRPNLDIALPPPHGNNGTSRDHAQVEHEGILSDGSTSSLSSIETQSQESQESSKRARNISSIEVVDQAAERHSSLKRKASEDLLENSSGGSSSEKGVHTHPPPRKQTRTDQNKNDAVERDNAK